MREEITSKTFELLDNQNIKEIIMRQIGLVDVFGKIEIDIVYNNGSKKELIGISPINVDEIKRWLVNNNLTEKARLYKY